MSLNLIKKFGLSDDEINLYGTDFLIQYLKYHHIKRYNETTILFLGFEREELNSLKRTAERSGLIVKERIGTLTFVCVGENYVDAKRIDKAKEYGAAILNKNEFLEIFKQGEYLINQNEDICLKSVREEFRITKPLSNFDFIEKVQSYSFDNKNVYSVNLYTGTCTCKDYILSNRSQFINGDLRRYCKHLRDLYNDCFSPKELKGINKYFIEYKFYLKSNFTKIKIQELDKYFYLGFNTGEGYCDFYFPTKDNSYEKYEYNYEDKYFDGKPHGFATLLRKELDDYFKTSRKSYKAKQERINVKEIKHNSDGCFGVVIFIILVMVFLFIVF